MDVDPEDPDDLDMPLGDTHEWDTNGGLIRYQGAMSGSHS